MSEEFERMSPDLRFWTLAILRDKIREQAKEIEQLKANQAALIETCLQLGPHADISDDDDIHVMPLTTR